MTTKRLSEKDVAHLIQRLIRQRSSGGKTLFRVSSDMIERRRNPYGAGDWFYVSLIASDPNMPMHRFSEMLGDIEQELEEKHGIDVLLVPTALTEA